jgi:hypothetical protein
MDANIIWKAQIEAGEKGNIEESLKYFAENCIWKLMSSNKIYNGYNAVERFIKNGYKSSVVKEKPDVIIEFSASEWGVYEYISRGMIGKNAIDFSEELNQKNNIFTKLKRQIMKKFFCILLSGITFEIPVIFVYHINDNGLIDKVHEYVGAKKIQRNIKYKK